MHFWRKLLKENNSFLNEFSLSLARIIITHKSAALSIIVDIMKASQSFLLNINPERGDNELFITLVPKVL